MQTLPDMKPAGVNTTDAPLILGSASPRRAKILRDLGVRFEILVPEVEETESHGTPLETARENALRKLAWCRQKRPGRRILTADTVVEFDGRAVGKPASIDEARDMFRQFSGKTQRVLTGIAYTGAKTGERVDVVVSVVRFRPLNDAVIAQYFREVDPLDKAGAYDIDQRGDLIVEKWEGSYTNIMGLPVEKVKEWLSEDGIL